MLLSYAFSHSFLLPTLAPSLPPQTDTEIRRGTSSQMVFKLSSLQLVASLVLCLLNQAGADFGTCTEPFCTSRDADSSTGLCACMSGWSGPECLVCQSDEACQTLQHQHHLHL